MQANTVEVLSSAGPDIGSHNLAELTDTVGPEIVTPDSRQSGQWRQCGQSGIPKWGLTDSLLAPRQSSLPSRLSTQVVTVTGLESGPMTASVSSQ